MKITATRRIYGTVTRFFCFFAILSLLVPMLAGCTKSEDSLEQLLEINPDRVQLRTLVSDTHYFVLGAKDYVSVYCENMQNRPENPVYEWNIISDKGKTDIVIHDSEPPPPTTTTTTGGESEYEDEEPPDPKHRWPNSDQLAYTCDTEGTYTFRVDLYSYEEYHKDKTKATLYASFSFTVHCAPLKFDFQITPTNNSREYKIKAVCQNVQYVPYLIWENWEFIGATNGQKDDGPTEQVSEYESLKKNGFNEIIHRFQAIGKYRVRFIITAQFSGTQVWIEETTFDVAQGIQIIAPDGILDTGTEYPFTARTDLPEALPDDVYYTWDFGDSPVLTIPGINTVTHVFTAPGQYAIHLGVFEPGEAADMPIGSAIAVVDVGGTLPEGLSISVTGPGITGSGDPLTEGKEYDFFTHMSPPEALPKNPVYVWGFPDAEQQEIPGGDQTVWTFTKKGNYLVWVDVYDTETGGKPLASASIDVRVVEAPETPANQLAHLREMKYIDLDFVVSGTLGTGGTRRSSISLDDFEMAITWNQLTFSSNWDKWDRVVNITGEVSEDGMYIKKMTVRYEAAVDKGVTEWCQLEIANLPLWEDNYNDMFNQRVYDRDVRQYVTSYTIHETVTWDWNDDVDLCVYFSPSPF